MDRPRLFLGLRTVIYGAPDLKKAKDFYSNAFGIEPYFDEQFYVGYNVGGYELGLDPNAGHTGNGGTIAYWGVADIEQALEHMKSIGTDMASEPQDVGGGIKVASVRDPFGNVIGIIENPHFDPSSTK